MKLKCLANSESFSDFTEEEIREITFEVDGDRYLWYYSHNGKWENCYLKNLQTHESVDFTESEIEDLEGVNKAIMQLWRNEGSILDYIKEGHIIDTSKFDLGDQSLDLWSIEGAIIR